MFCLLPESISLLLAQLLFLSVSLPSVPLKLELAGEQVDLLHPCPQLRTLRREGPRWFLFHLLLLHVCDLGGSVELSERRRNVVLQQGLQEILRLQQHRKGEERGGRRGEDEEREGWGGGGLGHT